VTKEDVQVIVRQPVSELARVVVVSSPQHGTEPGARPDAHGLVRVRATVQPGRDRVVAIAFTFETSGDVHIPPPW
jgi:hypothetical protein